MENISRYEQYADDCRRLAKQTKNTEQKKRLEEMAEVWERLARERRQGIAKLSNRRRVEPHREANSIPEFTSEIKLRRARPDEIAQGEEEPEKRRERELKKWREEHKAQLERE